MSEQPEAGWYPAPDGAPVQRWWDGQSWTEHTAPAPSWVQMQTLAATERTADTTRRIDLTLTADEVDQRIIAWARSLPPMPDPFAFDRYLNTPSMWEPDKSADPETMRQSWADAHDEFQRRMRGEGLRIDPTEGATDD